MFFTMLVALYTSRVILQKLGVDDFGIYNAVGGIVGFLSFLNSALATGSSRFLTFELGGGDKERLKRTFSSLLTAHIFLAFIIVILAETVGLWFLYNKMVIPPDRMTAAVVTFHVSIITAVITIIQVPYNASIISHEKMDIYAYLSIFEVVAKLALCFLLGIGGIDKLIFYAVSICLIHLAIILFYKYFCNRHYSETKLRFVIDYGYFKEILCYSGWNLFGSASSVVKKQVLTIILNMFYGPIISASRSVASQVNTAVTSFASNFSTALRPQIIKTYARSEKEESFSLVYRGCKLTYFLMYIITLPLLYEMEFILELWLKNPLEQVVIFTRLALVEALIISVSYPLMSLSHASGKIKLYQSVVGGCLLLNLPLSWFVLSLGYPAFSVMIVTVIIEVIAFILRLLVIRKNTGLPIALFIIKTIVPCMIVTVLSLFLPLLILIIMEKSVLRLLVIILISSLEITVLVFLIGLNKNEKRTVVETVKKRVKLSK